MKRLKLTKRTKTNKLPKMRYFKIPLCPKFIWCEKTKMPLGQKRLRLTQMRTKTIFVQNSINDSWKQLKRLRDKLQGLKMGSFVGNDQNTLLYDFMQKNVKDWSSNACSWSTIENMVNLKVLENIEGNWMSIFRSKMRVWHDECAENKSCGLLLK